MILSLSLSASKKKNSKRREGDVRKNAYTMKRSEQVPLERGRCMSGFLPRAPHARTLEAEESYMYVQEKPTGWREGFHDLSRGKE